MVSATLLRTRSGPLLSPITATEHEGSRSVSRCGSISPRTLQMGMKDRRFEPAIPSLRRTRSGPLLFPITATEHEGSRSVSRCGSISPRTLQMGMKDRRFEPAIPSLRRVRSEEYLARSRALVVASSRRSPGKTVEEDEEPEAETTVFACCPILSLGVPATAIVAASTASEAMPEELEFSGGCGGSGGGMKIGGGGRGGGGGGDPGSGMGAYYKEMLKADPENPLLLTNYGKFLKEVEGDIAGAEDCFGRAILANPSDGEALSLYGNLMWEAHGDMERAEDYLERAVEASPEDCFIWGSYANFLWGAEDQGGKRSGNSAPTNDAFVVEAY